MVKNNFTPKVSIVIPVYNGSNYLKEAIDSALAQTYKNIEVVVVNDGSKDDGATDKIARSYGKKIKYYKKENGGVATALNLGIKKMTGDYFSWLSHDDMYKTSKVERQVEFLGTIKNKKVILYSNYELMDENGKHTGTTKLDHEMLQKKQIYSLLRGNLNGITMLIPKAAFTEYGEFDASLRCTQDYDLWYDMIRTYKFVHLEDALSITRIHSMQDTQTSPNVVSEGNALWIKMIEMLPYKEKIKLEGSLLDFYFEMSKFLRVTPYGGALEYCNQKLVQAARQKEAVAGVLANPEASTEVYDKLVSEDQKKAASYYVANAIQQMARTTHKQNATIILKNRLAGAKSSVDELSITKHLLPKIVSKKEKPRLMFSSGPWLTGGVERLLSNIFKQLADDYELFLLTVEASQEGMIELPSYVTHLKMSNDFFHKSYAQTALSYALAFDVDVVLGFMNLIKGQIDFYELCQGTNIKTVASNNEMYFFPYNNPAYYELIPRRMEILKNLDVTLWSTNFSAAAHGLTSTNSYVMTNPNTYKVENNTFARDEKIILCVGRFNDYVKRVDRMLKCFSIVLKTVPDAKLVLVGPYERNFRIKPGEEATLEDLMNDLKLDESSVAFVGEASNVEDYYKKASLLLLTSMSEGFGMVINEAACFGVPTVANKIPGLEDLISEGKNGYLTEQDDLDAMASVVCKVLSDSQLRNRLGNNALKMVADYDEVKVGNRWKYLLKTLLNNNSGEDLRIALNKKLSYTVSDYEDFSKILFDEINKIIRVNYEANIEQFDYPYETTRSFMVRKTKHSYHRVSKTVRAVGYRRTGKLIVKKSYKKARRLFKSS